MTLTWTLAAACLLVGAWALSCVRRVQPGQWMVVTDRRGVVRRRPDGLAWRWPLVERFEGDLDQPHEQPVAARATTSDGVPVLVLAEATVSVRPPAVGTTYADPWPAAERAAEETIARNVAGWTASALTSDAEAAELPLRREVRAAVDEHGVEVHGLRLVEVDVRLDLGGSR